MTSRRAALRAAWTAPLVVAISPAPAQAVGSGGALDIIGTFTHSATTASFTGSVTNAGALTTSGLQVTFTLAGGSPGYGSTTASAITGFSVPTKSTVGNNVTFTYTATSQLAPGASRTLAPTFTIPSGMSNKPGTGTATATATNHITDSTTNNYT